MFIHILVAVAVLACPEKELPGCKHAVNVCGVQKDDFNGRQSFAIASLNNRTYVRIGQGAVAPLHEKKLEDHGFKTIGIIDSDQAKKEGVLARRLQWFESYEAALREKPSFWDICVPPEAHFSVMKKIIELDPLANMIVEKPVCLSSQIPELLQLMENFKGKIVVNENYLSSQVTQAVIRVAFNELLLVPSRIVVEMDKNRIDDTRNGRYIDPEGALKYEGPHMVANLQAVLDQFKVQLPSNPYYISYEDLVFSDQALKNQGSADIQFRSGDLCRES